MKPGEVALMQTFATRINETPAPLVLLAHAPADEQEAAAEHGDAVWLDLWDDRECIGTLFLDDGVPDPAAVLALLVAAGLDIEVEPATDIAKPYVHGWRGKANGS